MSNTSTISRLGSTGVLTDYFDTERIQYLCLNDFFLNRPDSFVIGPVRTVNCEDGAYDDENISLGLGYLDEIDAGDILVINGSEKWAYFGELMSTIAVQRNLKSAIVLGKTRDSRFTRNIFPVWSSGYTPVDIKGRGRVHSVGSPLKFDGHTISEGMMCAADNDGIIFFESLPEIHFKNLEKVLIHEQKIMDLISQDNSVQDILKFTTSF